MEERRVLYKMLRDQFDLSRTGLLNLLQVTAGKDSWRYYAEQSIEVDAGLERSFLQELRTGRDLLQELRAVDATFHTFRKNVPREESDQR